MTFSTCYAPRPHDGQLSLDDLPTTLEAYAAHVPAQSYPLEEVGARLKLTRAQMKVLRRVYGVREMRLDRDGSLFDLLLPAAREVTKELTDPSTVKYLLYGHATQEVTPSTLDAADVLRVSLGLHEAQAIGLTQQNCAIGLAAIDMAGALLAMDGDPTARALVVTGEKPFTKLNHDYHTFGSVMGEAASACLVARGGRGDRVLSYVTKTRGEFANGILLDQEGRETLNNAHDPEVAVVVREAVAKAGLTLDDIHRVAHYNSLMVEVSEALEMDRSRFFTDNLPRYSHCYASDAFVNYTTMRDTGQLEPGRHYLFIATGLGSTYAAMVVTHAPDGDG